MAKPNKPPKRPSLLDLTSLAQLYRDFERLFLHGVVADNHRHFVSECGHRCAAFDHNFFHLVKLTHPTRGRPNQAGNHKFRAAEEIPLILAQVSGFGQYQVDLYRARSLHAAYATFQWPDAIVERSDLDNATHVFFREYENPKFPYTVFLTKLEKGHYVPVTSFAVEKRRSGRYLDEGANAVRIWNRLP